MVDFGDEAQDLEEKGKDEYEQRFGKNKQQDQGSQSDMDRTESTQDRDDMDQPQGA